MKNKLLLLMGSELLVPSDSKLPMQMNRKLLVINE